MVTPTNSTCPSADTVPPTPAAPTSRPPRAVTIPTESTLVTSSYVRTPVNVAATPVILLIVISGVPLKLAAVPEVFWFKVATLAAATVPEAIAVPLKLV